MATEAHSNVTVAISVVDKATPAIESITGSLNKIEEAQKQINETAKTMAKDVPRSVAEMVKEAPGNIFKMPVRGEDVIPDIAPPARAQMEQVSSIFDQLGVRLKSIGDSIQRKFASAFEAIGAIGKRIGGVLSTVFSGWGAFVGGFGIGTALDAMVSGMDELVKTVDKLGPQAASMGLTIQEFQRLSVWAKEGGVPVNRMATSLQNLTRTMGGVNEGLKGFGKAEDAFRALGLLDEATGRLKAQNAPELLRQLGPALAAIQDPAERAARAAAILGTSWREMMPLIMQGPEAMDAAAEASRKLGEISPQMEQAALDYNKATAQFAQGMSALRMEIGATLIPVITPAIKELTDFIANNREAVVAVFKGAADAVIGFFETVGPVVKSTAADIQAIKSVFVWLEEHIPQLKAATPVGPLFSSEIPAEFQLPEIPDPSKWADPVTKIRDLIINAMKEIRDALQTPLGEIWGGVADSLSRAWETIKPILDQFWNILQQIAKWSGFGGVTDAFNSIATSVGKAADAWERWKGTSETPTAQTAVSPGGGPISWEDLAGARGGIVPGAAPSGEVKVTIENKNPPPGTRTTATATGPGVTADVGQSMPWTAPGYSGGPWAPAGA